MKRAVALGFLLAALASTLAPARAEAPSHGRTVWFSTVRLGDGDVVRGNLDIVFGNVSCGAGAVVDGDVREFFGRFDQLDDCVVTGRVVNAFDGDAIPWAGPLSHEDFLTQYGGFSKLLAWNLLVVFAFLLFPVRVRVALDRIEKHPALSGVAGVAAAVAVFPVAILLLFSVIGIPLIPIEFAALFACFWIGSASIALLLGRRLYELLVPRATPSPLAALVLGLLLITAAESFPLVGWAVAALVVLVGLGAACLGFVRESSFRAFTHGSPTAPERSTPPMNRPA